MKAIKIILPLLIVAIAGCKDRPKENYVQPKQIVVATGEPSLKIGDRFYFGYDEKSPDLFKVVGFNKEGIYCVWNFQNSNDDPHWFPYADVYHARNFKKLSN